MSKAHRHAASLLHSLTMSLIYGDSFQDDEDLCNILKALQLGSGLTSAVRDPDPVVAQAARSTQCVYNETRAGRPSLALHDQPLAPIAGSSSKLSTPKLMLLMIFIISGPVPLASIPDGGYSVLLGKRTGVRNTWYIL